MNTELWNKCVEYHGHVCGGIALGYMAARYAGELLDIKDGDDIHILAATAKCPVDAFPVILNCSRENGLQKQICSANVGCSPTPRQRF